MTFISVRVHNEVDVDLDEVLTQADDKELADALRRRNGWHIATPEKLILIYEEFRRRGDAPQILKDYLYDTIGRIL